MNQSNVWGRRLPWWAVAGVLGVLSATVIAGGWYALRPPADGPQVAYRPLLPAGTYPTRPLSPGEVAPPVEAAGWLNGPPAAATDRRLLVLDVWSSW